MFTQQQPSCATNAHYCAWQAVLILKTCPPDSTFQGQLPHEQGTRQHKDSHQRALPCLAGSADPQDMSPGQYLPEPTAPRRTPGPMDRAGHR
jgi:hypothetical protein